MTKCSAENLSVTALANNQLSGYIYDAAGNMTSDPTDNATLSYDQENRITGANGYTYTYDGDGNRVSKSSGTTGTLYWYMTPGVVAETDLAGTLKSEYVFFDGERFARKDFSGSTTSVSYYFSDHLKTTNIVTDAQGNIKNESDFYPWGGELQFSNGDSNHYKFTGKERDSETGLDYFGARHYSNGLGRFITPDWSAVPVPVPYADQHDPQTLNQYSYVRNIPTVKTDADGHDPDVIFKDPDLETMFNKIGAESPTFKTELDAARADHNIIVTVQDVGLQRLGDHAPADMKASQDADGQVHATINVNRADEKNAEHEMGHEKDARTNTSQFFKDAIKDKNDKGGPAEKSHDERPVEKRADQFKDTVEKERKQHHDQQKQQQKQQNEQRQQKQDKEPQ